MPIPVIAPMEYPIKGFSSPRDARTKTTALVHGGTSLKLSEGGESPVLEAHPGSPVEIKPRPSLATSMAVQRLYHGSDEEFSRFGKHPKSPGTNAENIIRDGVAAKEGPTVAVRAENNEAETRAPRRKIHGLHPFYIPAKVPEQEEVHYVHPLGNDKILMDASVESTEMDFEFEEDNGIWISASPIVHGSKTSLTTMTTGTSGLTEDKTTQGALTVDTSIASSGASMISSRDSIYSAITTNSSDIYGWEEELDRKSTVEGHHMWGREPSRRLPSGGRTMGPRLRTGNMSLDGKRKSLLHRVLNLSGSRRSSTDDIVMSGGITDFPCPTTSG